ncbi:uncharacterized protein LOC130681981 [Manis pentadactyla]|uniref:uncharacterized protein LOC130681981 n=1 Tax=Manis pentadactyla TaxID=143292 RepID=UPI00255C4DBD|nr:uncharacterized protein LOC130681981 [Manis pentadactyla]
MPPCPCCRDPAPACPRPMKKGRPDQRSGLAEARCQAARRSLLIILSQGRKRPSPWQDLFPEATRRGQKEERMTGREEGKHPWFLATRKKGRMPVLKSPWFVKRQTWGARAGLYYTAGCPRITPPGLPTPTKPPPPHPTPPEWPLLVVPGTARARSQVLPGLAEGRGTSELGPRASRRRLGRRGVEGSAHSWGRGRPECPAYRPGSSQRVSNNLSPSGAGTAPSCGSGGEPNSPVTGTWLHRRWGPAQTRPRPQSLSTLPFQNCRRHRPQIPRTKQAPRATYADDLDARLCALFFRFHKQDLTGEPFLPVAHTSPEFRCPEPT